jgi:heme/copper-type cytochrome/quinol oxidase subunit 1
VAAAAGRARHGAAAAECAVLLDLSLRGHFLYSGFAVGFGPDAGWFNYVPLAARAYNNGPNIDLYALGMILLGISTTVGSINFVVTFLRMRAPGMSINRVPILIWGTLTASAANIFAIPAVSAGLLPAVDGPQSGTHFFDAGGGGSAMLWQHLFWMFGHPWVYAIVLPAMGMVSDGLPVFCRRPLVGYTRGGAGHGRDHGAGLRRLGAPHVRHRPAGRLAVLLQRRLHHHRPAVSAVGVFAWLATIWTGRPVFTTPFLFFASFIILFTIGGVSGYMTARCRWTGS